LAINQWNGRDMNIQLKFHQGTYELVGKQPRLAENNQLAIEKFQTYHNVSLPESVIEWYSLANSIEILREYSNHDTPITIDALMKQENPIEDGKLVFLVETQGVYHWGVMLDTPDPLVYVRTNDKNSSWTKSNVQFSDFIQKWVWDYQGYLPNWYQVQLIDNPIEVSTLDKLRDEYSEVGSSTVTPATVTYRFQQNRHFIKIMSLENQADWYLYADNKQSFLKLLNQCEAFLDGDWKAYLTPWNDHSKELIESL
jgi:hypothetical protein